MASVVQVWLSELNWKQQTVVLTALRGCDGIEKENPSKVLSRLLRGDILMNADNSSSYMKKFTAWEVNESIKKLFDDLDRYPIHFITHLCHAAEIIGYKHPDENIRRFWFSVYLEFCMAIHVNAETENQLDERLFDNKGADK
jgi:hypothetical protein